METIKPIIELSNVHKHYGGTAVLKGISFRVFPGEIIGYIGPNGAGKSTTVKIICGLLGNFEGEVLVNDISVKKDPLAVKRMVGYIPELADMYEVLTPFEYLTFMGALYDLDEKLVEKRIRHMLSVFSLEGHMHQRMETFSKGMRQKVLITAGLLHNPEIIIMDEPLSGLDANSIILVKDLIAQMAQAGKTIFYSSHMMDVVEKVSHRIILINKGLIAADGSFETLKAGNGHQNLEALFSSLTQNPQKTNTAADFLAAFD